MMFDKILATLSENGKSGHAYRKVIMLAETAMQEDNDRATGYLLLKILAERFIDSTGRLATTATQTENAYNDFAKHVSTLTDAYAAQDASAISNALNTVSLASIAHFDPTSSAN